MTTLDVALVVVRLGVGCWLLWSVRGLAGRPGAVAAVSVVVPARDEAGALPSLLSSITPGTEVIVVDDHSRDRTPQVAAEAGVRVVPAGDLPDGWIGKSWACATGAGTASGETLVFVDADVRFSAGGLDAVVGELTTSGGLVSVQPFHEPGRLVERLAQLFNVVAFAGTDAGSPVGRRWGVRGAFGPVLATSRRDYEAVGGHAAVRASVVDDVALADRYRSAGLPVTVRAGRDDVSFRMYPDGLRQLVEGFTKNMAAGVTAVRRGTAALVALWLSLLVQASVAPIRSAVAGDADALRAAALLYVAVALQLWWMSRRLGRFGFGVSLAFPVSTALFLFVFARSVWATATGTVSWRGREVPTRRGG